MAEGEFALVRQHLEAALHDTAEWVGDHDIYVLLADAAARQDDLPALQRYAPLAEETAIRYDHRLYQAIAHRAFGVAHRLAGEYDQARDRLQNALDIFTLHEARWQIGRTYFELGRLAQDQTDSAMAIEHFNSALVEFEKQGAVPNITHTRGALAELGSVSENDAQS